MPTKFYTIEQVCEFLGVTEEDVKSMVSDGRLREVRDAGKRFYRSDDVDRLAGKEGSSIVDLAVTDEGIADVAKLDETESFASALSSLADSSSSLSILEDSAVGPSEPAVAQSFGSDIELEGIPDKLPAAKRSPGDSSVTDLSSEIGLLPEDDSVDRAKLSGAEEVPDFGLSGSDVINLESSDDLMKKAKEDTRITSAGISVFDDDELEVDADPMGKTHVAPAVEDFDAVGSGSGLLDLTRESDDTSLGAELLDVISPTEETEAETAVADDAVVATVTAEESAVDDVEEAAYETVAAPVAVRRTAAAVAGETPLNIGMFLGLLGLTVIGLATAAQIQGVWPEFLTTIARGTPHLAVFVGLFVIAAAVGIWSILSDRK
jgi:excisionase family DNA binding protein